MKKITIIQWFVQFLLAALLSSLVGIFLVGGSSILLIKVPLACTIGLVVGDISLYRRCKFSILAVVITPLLGRLGVYFALLFSDLILLPSLSLSKIGNLMSPVFFFSIVTIPPLIGYNIVSFLSRKFWSRRKEKKQENQQKQ